MTDGRVPDEAWRTVVRHVPIVSVDLVVRNGDRVLLGRRTNAPAEGEWFVPGGRVHKHERLSEAVRRVAREELGATVTVEEQLGVYEHRYDVAEFEGIDGKHYVPVGYLVSTTGDEFTPDEQHDELRWFSPPFEAVDLHPYVERYLVDAGFDTDTGPDDA